MARPKNEIQNVRLVETVSPDTMYDWLKFKKSERADVALRSLLWHAAETGYKPFPFSKPKK